MLITGLQGSPRKNGNTAYLISTFMEEAEKIGAQTRVVDVPRSHIQPCRGCGYCEKKGYCVITDDDMAGNIYHLLKISDVIVAATPVFFYSPTAQIKALIDRSQTLWSRKYVLKLRDPRRKNRLGIVLSIGATNGENLFQGIHLTMKYFFDAVSARHEKNLTYRAIEKPGDMKSHPNVHKDIKDTVQALILPLLTRKKVMFVCKGNSCRSQIAEAFLQHFAGDRVDAFSSGTHPEDTINPDMVAAMADRGLDTAFRKPKTIDTAIAGNPPDIVVTMGNNVVFPPIQGAETVQLEIPDPYGKSMEVMHSVRDRIEKSVLKLISEKEI